MKSEYTERILSPELKAMVASGALEPNLRFFEKGELQIFTGWTQGDGWHLSISHPDRYPVWDEIRDARYALLPDDVMIAMFLPPMDEYVNVHPNCFQLWEGRKGSGAKDRAKIDYLTGHAIAMATAIRRIQAAAGAPNAADACRTILAIAKEVMGDGPSRDAVRAKRV